MKIEIPTVGKDWFAKPIHTAIAVAAGLPASGSSPRSAGPCSGAERATGARSSTWPT